MKLSRTEVSLNMKHYFAILKKIITSSLSIYIMSIFYRNSK